MGVDVSAYLGYGAILDQEELENLWSEETDGVGIDWDFCQHLEDFCEENNVGFVRLNCYSSDSSYFIGHTIANTEEFIDVKQKLIQPNKKTIVKKALKKLDKVPETFLFASWW